MFLISLASDPEACEKILLRQVFWLTPSPEAFPAS